MTMSNKWLIGIGAALAVLVVVAIVLTLATGGRRVKTYPEDSPEGTVQRYLQALIARDLETAYEFLSPDLQSQCPLSSWRSVSRFGVSEIEESEVTLGGTRRTGDDVVTVTVAISRTESPGLIDVRPRQYSFEQDLHLLKEADGVWRFSQPPWPVFGCPPRDVPVKPIPAPPEAVPPPPSPSPARD